jgi:hypothetical protein
VKFPANEVIEMRRVIAIVGSRRYKNKEKMFEILDWFFEPEKKEDWLIVSGGADGVDKWAEEWCELRGFDIKVFPILNGEHPFDRNFRVADASDQLLGFVNKGQYRSGTWNTISFFRKKPDNLGYLVFDQYGDIWDRKWKLRGHIIC